MIIEYLPEFIAAISGLLGGSGIGLFLGKKKYNAEVESDQIDNLKKSLDFYITTVEDNNIRLGNLREQNQNLEIKVSELKDENNKLKDLVIEQQRNIQELTSKIEVLTGLINKLTTKANG